MHCIKAFTFLHCTETILTQKTPGRLIRCVDICKLALCELNTQQVALIWNGVFESIHVSSLIKYLICSIFRKVSPPEDSSSCEHIIGNSKKVGQIGHECSWVMQNGLAFSEALAPAGHDLDTRWTRWTIVNECEHMGNSWLDWYVFLFIFYMNKYKYDISCLSVYITWLFVLKIGREWTKSIFRKVSPDKMFSPEFRLEDGAFWVDKMDNCRNA